MPSPAPWSLPPRRRRRSYVRPLSQAPTPRPRLLLSGRRSSGCCCLRLARILLPLSRPPAPPRGSFAPARPGSPRRRLRLRLRPFAGLSLASPLRLRHRPDIRSCHEWNTGGAPPASSHLVLHRTLPPSSISLRPRRRSPADSASAAAATETSGRPLLEVRGLTASVKDTGVQIPTGVDFTIREDEIHAVMGTNGSGKSTLTKVLVRHPVCKVTSGTILVKGENLVSQQWILLSFIQL